jgi:hypothetical protein
MPIYRQTKSFKGDYGGLDEDIKTAAKKAFRQFQQNPSHPSLYVHKLDGHKGIFGGHITDKYVFTFHKEKSSEGELIYWFRRIGDHTVYKNP